MAKAKSLGFLTLLAGVALTASCDAEAVRRSRLMALRPVWTPSPAATALAPPARRALEPESPALAPTSPQRDPLVDLISQVEQRQALLKAQRDWNRLMDEYRARELESLQQTPEIVSRQSEPLLFEDLLRLNIQEDTRVSPDLQRLLLATRSDLPLTVNDQVLRYVNYFLGRGRTTLRESLRRAGSYRPMISRILAEEGVPQDLIYLVQAESGFRPQARSNKKATGMWQFVAGRGREYGLNQNRHVDERLDPEKATRAAARHLADLHAQFGSWYLAMAAYNCGPGGVQRAVERSGFADYWELSRRGVLPRETSNYVPIILAMALLAKNGTAFHLSDIVPENPIDYDTIETHSRIGLGLVADATGATVEQVRRLNPALLGQATPEGLYSLRIPKNTATQFENEIAAVPEMRRQSWRRHEVRETDTLEKLATLYKVKPSEIIQVNHFGDDGIKPGERITIPVPYRPEVIRASMSTGTAATRNLHYRVRPGDSLAAIARRHRVTVAQLRQWNGIQGNKVEAGQVLSIRVASARPASAGHAGARGPTRSSSHATARSAVPSRA